jgi:hypothetical protein
MFRPSSGHLRGININYVYKTQTFLNQFKLKPTKPQGY